MAEITKQALKVDNNTSFPNNNNGAITPAILRAFNVNMIDSMVDELGYNVDSASWNQQIDSLEQFTASLSTAFVSTASFNAFTASTNAYTASNNTKWNNAEVATASLFTSVSNLNTTTASLLVETQNLELFSASALVSISNLNQATASYVTETESGSFLITASFDNGNRNLTFTKGNNTTFAVNIPDVSGSAGGNFVTTSSFNSYTASTDSSISQLNASSASQQISIDNLNTTTASLLVETQNLELFSASALVSISNLNQSSASQQVSINSLNAATASYVTETESGSFLLTASFDNGTRNLTFTKGNNTTFAVNIPDVSGSAGNFVTTSSFNSYTASTDSRLTNIETTTASLLIETQNLELFSASALTSISNINQFTQSAGISINALNSATSSYITESETSSFARTNVDNNFTANQTFTNITATSASITYLTTLYETSSVIYSSGSNQFGDELTDIQTLSGSVKVQGSLTVNGTPVLTSSVDISGLTTTASFNAYTQSNDQRVSSLETNSASVNISINNINTTTASLNTSVTNLNASSASQQISIDNLNTNSASVNTSITNLNSATASLFSSASLALVTASFNNGTRNLTFTKGDTTQFSVNIPDVSGSTINTGSLMVTGSVIGNVLTFTKGDASTFALTVATGSGGTTDITALNQFTASQEILNTTFATTGSNTFIGTQNINNGEALIFRNAGLVDYGFIGLKNTSGSLDVVSVGGTNTKVDLQNLSLLVSGTFTASLQQGYVWVGDSSGKTTTVSTSSFGSTINTGSFATTGSNTFIGNQTISGSLFVSGSEVLTGTLSASALRVENNTLLDGQLRVTNDAQFDTHILIQGTQPHLKLRDTSGGGFSSGYDIRIDTGSFEIYDDTHNRDVLSDFFNSASQQHTTSLTSEIIVISGSTSVTLIGNVSASIISASTINGLGDPLVFSTSVDSRLDSLEGITASVNTSASLALYTASFDTGSRNLTFTKGDTTTFAVNIPDVSGSTIDTGSFATTGSNVFTGDQTLVDAAGNSITLSDVSGSLMLVPKGFTSSSLHISASASGSGNLIFKINNLTVDTIISGSGNIFTNAFTATAGFKRYIGGSNNFYNTSILPQISSSMQFSPAMNRNIGGGAYVFRAPVSSSTYTINDNLLLNGAVNFGTAAAPFTGMVAGCNFQQNIFAGGTINMTSNVSTLDFASNINTNIIFGATVNINNNSSSVSYISNIQNGGITINNNYVPVVGSTSAFRTAYASINTVYGISHRIDYAGTNATTSSLRSATANLLAGTYITASIQETGDRSSLIATNLMGNGLIVSGTSVSPVGSATPLADATYGTVISGRFNAVDGNRAKSAETIFAIGTGTGYTNRKTGFLIDSGSNTFIEGTLNVSGSTTITGSLILSSSNAVELQVIGDTQFTGAVNITGGFTASLQQGFVYVGNASGITTTVATSSFGGGAAFPFTGSAQITGSLGVTGSVSGFVNTLSISSNTASLDFNNGNFFTLQLVSGSITHLTATNIRPGQTINLLVKTDSGSAAASGSLTFSPTFKFAGGFDYTPTQITASQDLVSFVTFDTTQILASQVKNLS
jgi:hypothetical protein